MNLAANLLIGAVAALHVYFLVLEMFLWQKPAGLRIFGLTPEFAEESAALAKNQGLYNGFLAAGLIWGLEPWSERDADRDLLSLLCRDRRYLRRSDGQSPNTLRASSSRPRGADSGPLRLAARSKSRIAPKSLFSARPGLPNPRHRSTTSTRLGVSKSCQHFGSYQRLSSCRDPVSISEKSDH